MNNDIIKSAKNFLRKELKYEVTFENIASYLQKSGYVLVFYNPEKGNELIESLNLSEYSETVHAFTVKYKGTNAVFIDSNISTQDKLSSMLHEVAHIYLNHLGPDKIVVDDRLQEMQAETFAYEVLNYKRTPRLLYLVPCVTALLVLATATYAAYHQPYIPELISVPEPIAAETVYITQTGTKYHRSSCIYVKNKDCIEVVKEQAGNAYAPCLVCNP